MQPTIYLAFVDDWELRGDGSGDLHRLQISPMRELVRIYNAHGIRGSFNVEVMQQLTFRRFQGEHPELKALADDWEAAVQETFRQGHDIQLHIHPQWQQAKFENGQWLLSADWSILNHDPDVAYEMLSAGKNYLEGLLRSIDPSYRCVSFRAGAWCIAPSPFVLNLLVRLGIVFDMSIVGGISYHTHRVQLNYLNCEEAFLPYYPMMTDARKVSNQQEAIICVPTNHFHESRIHLFQKHLGKLKQKIMKPAKADSAARQSDPAQSYYQEWAESESVSQLRRLQKNVLAPYLTGKHLISDIAQLDYSLLSEMLSSIRKRARKSGLSEVPIILENHTKDIQDFSHIERFIKDVSRAADIKCVTLSELAQHLRSGRFSIRTAASR